MTARSAASSTAAPRESLAERLLRGEAAALSRAITAVESGGREAAEILSAIQPRLGRAQVVGFTGPPGAGKSTLVSAFITGLRRQGKTVGVVAVDPSSPVSGGAILGDRIRMGDHSADPGVFVRSLASRGHLGGLARTAGHAVDVMDAAGRDVVILETVGAGQSEVEIAESADTTVVVCAPGLGDDVQALKAGILEIADIFAVNKGDLMGAERTARQLRAMLKLRAESDWTPPVVTTVATSGDGVGELAEAVVAHGEVRRRAGLGRDPALRMRRLLASAAAERFRQHLSASGNSEVDRLAEAVQSGEVSFDEAVARLLGSST